ncbi:MAG TPA: Crp/Fnr family transcriptional regulator [Candidatus Angelobacter sp.]|nr:Crp/Fnr family transcriptional regulator [Candidatus Angelobacter sp.]
MSLENVETNELYAMLPPHVRQELEDHKQVMTAPRGTLLLDHGVLPDRLVILNKGSVQITVPCKRHSASVISRQAGKVFGMRAVMSGELPEIDVVCLEPCEITLLPREIFLALLKNYPEIYFAVAKVLSADLQIADCILRDHLRRGASAPRVRATRPV